MPSTDDAKAERLAGAVSSAVLDLQKVSELVKSVHTRDFPKPGPVPDKHVRIGAWLYVEKAHDPLEVAAVWAALTTGGRSDALGVMQPWIQKMLGVTELKDTYASFTLDAAAALEAARQHAHIIGPYYALFCLGDVPCVLPNVVNRARKRLVPQCFVVHGLNKREITASNFDLYEDVQAHVAKPDVSEVSNKAAIRKSHRKLGYKRITVSFCQCRFLCFDDAANKPAVSTRRRRSLPVQVG